MSDAAYKREWRWRTGRNRPLEVHLAEVRARRRHGTSPMYLKARCRCAACRAWNRRRMAAWRARKREAGDQTAA